MKRKKPGPTKGKKHDHIQRSPLGDRICRTRKSRGLTQAGLGALTGLSKRMVAHYEAGSKAMTVQSLEKFASALSVTVAYLMGEHSKSAENETGVDTSRSLRKRIETLRKLPQADQQAIFRMIDNAAQKAPRSGT